MTTINGTNANGNSTDTPAHTPHNGARLSLNAEQRDHLFGLLRQRLEQQNELINNFSFLSRTWMAAQADPRRNLYDECGWPGGSATNQSTDVSVDLYRQLYDREPIATRIVELMPKECWQVQPTVFENEDIDVVTPFEEAVDGLGRQLRVGGEFSWYQDEAGSSVWEKLQRVDILSGIGHFGVLLLGIDDGKNLQEPLDGVMTLNDGPILSDEVTALRSPQPRWKASNPEKERDGGPGRGIATNEDRLGASPITVNQQRIVDNWEKERERCWTLNDDGTYAINQRVYPDTCPHCKKSWQVKDDPAKHDGNCLSCNRRMPLTLNADAAGGGYLRRTVKRDRGNHVSGKEPSRTAAQPLDPTDPRFAQHQQMAGDAIDQLRSQQVMGVDSQYDDAAYGMGMPPPAGSLGYSLSGTDEQYFGVQFGPSEMPTPPTDPKTSRINPMGQGNDGPGTVGGRAGGVQQRGSPLDTSGDTPRQRPRLLFLRAYGEDLVQVVRYEWNIRNPRFGMPVMYRITLNDPRTTHSGIGLPLATVFVHWSRVIHVAETNQSGGVSASEVFAVPRIQCCLNNVLDIQKVRGAAAEGYYKSCFNGLQFVTHPQLGSDVLIDEEGLKDQGEQFQNSLKRIMTATGGSWQTIAPSVVDPTPYVAINVEAICVVKGCPVRIFKGSERGELASSQDDSSWNDRKRERQVTYMTPCLVVPLFDRLIQIGVLPPPGMQDSKKKVDNIRRTQPWATVERSKRGGGWVVTNYRRPLKNAAGSIPREVRDAARQIRSIDGAMPGYGQLYWNAKERHVWYVGGDGDEDDFYRTVKSLLNNLPGVRRVTYEAEAFPPRDSKDWVLVNPTQTQGGQGTRNDISPSVGDTASARDQANRAKRNVPGGPDAFSQDAMQDEATRRGWTPLTSSEDAAGGAKPSEFGQTGVKPSKATTLFISDAGYSVEWPDVEALSKKDKAGIAMQYTQALAAYVSGGCEAYMSFKNYLIEVWGWSDEKADACVEATQQMHSDAETLGTPAKVEGHDVEPPDGSKDAADQEQKQDQFNQMQQQKQDQFAQAAAGKGAPGGQGTAKPPGQSGKMGGTTQPKPPSGSQPAGGSKTQPA